MTPDPVKARRFAEIAHAGKLYDAGLPYTVHLEAVVSVLSRFGVTDPLMVSAGWLHDSIEDTGTSYNDLKKDFGGEVAELVYTVTNELGRSRVERNAKTYPKIAGNEKATTLKLADRIANVEQGLARGGKNDMYAVEYPTFKAALYAPSTSDILARMWAHLDLLLVTA